LLCKVYIRNVDVGQWMIQQGKAKAYTPKR